MSANHARRHRTGHAEVTDLSRRQNRNVLGLLALRDRLAIAAAEHEAHDLEGVTELLTQLYQVESAIRTTAPSVYEARWTEWVERDTALAHTPPQHHPECGVCKMLMLHLGGLGTNLQARAS